MVLLSKKERDMSAEEKAKLNLMKALLLIENRVNFADTTVDFDLTWDSHKGILIDTLLTLYPGLLEFLSKTAPDWNKLSLPEKLTTWPGETYYEEKISFRGEARDNAIRLERNTKLMTINSVLQSLNKKNPLGSDSELPKPPVKNKNKDGKSPVKNKNKDGKPPVKNKNEGGEKLKKVDKPKSDDQGKNRDEEGINQKAEAQAKKSEGELVDKKN